MQTLPGFCPMSILQSWTSSMSAPWKELLRAPSSTRRDICQIAPQLRQRSLFLFFLQAMDVRADFPAIDKWLQAFEARLLCLLGHFLGCCEGALANSPQLGNPIIQDVSVSWYLDLRTYFSTYSPRIPIFHLILRLCHLPLG